MTLAIARSAASRRDALCEAAIASVKAFADDMARSDPDAAAAAYVLMRDLILMRREAVAMGMDRERLRAIAHD